MKKIMVSNRRAAESVLTYEVLKEWLIYNWKHKQKPLATAYNSEYEIPPSVYSNSSTLRPATSHIRETPATTPRKTNEETRQDLWTKSTPNNKSIHKWTDRNCHLVFCGFGSKFGFSPNYDCFRTPNNQSNQNFRQRRPKKCNSVYF